MTNILSLCTEYWCGFRRRFNIQLPPLLIASLAMRSMEVGGLLGSVAPFLHVSRLSLCHGEYLAFYDELLFWR
jgi:hypothetical protein